MNNWELYYPYEVPSKWTFSSYLPLATVNSFKYRGIYTCHCELKRI